MIKHLSLIMDGNRRWAKNQGLMSFNGHRKGLDAIRIVCAYALENNIDYVSLYTFSLENLKRSAQEQDYLFSLIIDQAEKLGTELQQKGIKIRFLGNKNYFPEHVLPAIQRLHTATEAGDKLQLNLLFCYGGRQDIVAAAQQIATDAVSGKLDPAIIDEKLVSTYLQTSGMPDPEIVIRTGGMQRLSNFLPYETIYSELYFTPTLWPDITKEELESIMQDFSARKRNFGV